tara:strand:+ start:197 stop:313 length:117 start_codon:yes stop_codon:yes gene_type:complete
MSWSRIIDEEYCKKWEQQVKENKLIGNPINKKKKLKRY